MDNDDLQQEALKSQQGKSQLEQRVKAGIHGGFELKKGEKNRFLGEFKERVLKVLTKEQVEEPGTYREILESIKDQEAKKLIISRRVNMDRARDYVKLARENNLSFKKVESRDFVGDIALVVVSDHAVNFDNIFVQDRVARLKEKGIPLELINAVGTKVCNECYQLLEEKEPKELGNYKKLSWWDKLLGKKCSGH